METLKNLIPSETAVAIEHITWFQRIDTVHVMSDDDNILLCFIYYISVDHLHNLILNGVTTASFTILASTVQFQYHPTVKGITTIDHLG